MPNKIISLPENALINMLKTLPEDLLVNLFWKTLIKNDTSPLSLIEKKEIKKAKNEYKKHRTVPWENLK
jgi:hypothetical protein